MKIGIAPRPFISESSWTGLGSRHREQNFVCTKLSRCNCIGTRLHPDSMLLPFRCPMQTGNCSCLRNQLLCTVFCVGEGNWLCWNSYTENTDDGDDDLHMFDYADADFTGNWSLWRRTSSMIWYYIKPHNNMKGPKILVKHCIKVFFFHENLMLWMYSVMWHSKSPTNKNNLCAFILLYRYHTQRTLHCFIDSSGPFIALWGLTWC